MRAHVNGIELEYELFGAGGTAPAPPPLVVLISGFSQQMTSWDPAFCERLAGRGFRVVRFDSRDVGLSSKIEGGPRPRLSAVVGGDLSTLSYALTDMADDTAGLIEALGAGSAHVVGVSMGGMIAQTLAIHHPDRVKSLVSIMSTTGDRSVGYGAPDTLALMGERAPTDREANIEYGLRVWRKLSSTGFAHDEAAARLRIGRNFDRSFYPEGVARQLAALLGQPNRTNDLAGVRAPTTVIHGADDSLIHVSGGEATARAIPGAKLIVVPGMGHELPEGAWPIVIDAVAALALACAR
jgi:pimeloyl-ACP methyl ester carboxylesterase